VEKKVWKVRKKKEKEIKTKIIFVSPGASRGRALRYGARLLGRHGGRRCIYDIDALAAQFTTAIFFKSPAGVAATFVPCGGGGYFCPLRGRRLLLSPAGAAATSNPCGGGGYLQPPAGAAATSTP
jgi:hypothetical protein